MNKSNFQHLKEEFPILYNIGRSAEYNLYQDPVTSLFKLRQWIEKMAQILFDEHRLEFPRDTSLNNLLKELDYENILPGNIRDLLFNIKNKGNIAVHKIRGNTSDAKGTLLSTFKVSKWFYEAYSREMLDVSELRFKVPPNLDARHALHELEKSHKELETKFKQLLEERSKEKLSVQQEQVIRKKSNRAAWKIKMSETETRSLIDQQLREAGWEVDTDLINYKKHKTLPEHGKNKAIAEWRVGRKYADYALFIGMKLYGIIEAKKYAADIPSDLQQSKIYAALAAEKHGIEILGKWQDYYVPFLFSTNGRPYLEQLKTKSGIWFLDVRKTRNHSRALQGWYSPEGLEQLLEQDNSTANEELKDSDYHYLQKGGLSLRDYQIKAIKAVEDSIIEAPQRRKILLAMATGTGKTRTIMGLCYRLIKSNRFRRILFLVDRRLLANQAFDSFKDNKIEDLNTFSDIYEVKGLKDKSPDLDTRLHFATVQSMVQRLFYTKEDQTPLPVDTYDCIIVDEAHRGYLLDREMGEEDLNFKNQMDYVSKYRKVLEYFDAYSIGLTATPALHTRAIFGAPVFTYSYREAVIDGWLIDHEPPIKIKTKLSEEGILWEKGDKPKVYDKESNTVVELDELEDELQIEIDGFNTKVIAATFNRTVIQQLVKELDPEGDEKTLVFAARNDHADLIVQQFKEEFSNIGVEVPNGSIVKITGSHHDPQKAVRCFKNEKAPNIVVTVDLLTTGIDIPAICNIVFLRRVRSRILYEQMLGRATRLCKEINKEVFRIYDAVRLYEALQDYTQMKPVSPTQQTTFQQLMKESSAIASEERLQQQLEQIIAKFQRKKHYLTAEKEDQFMFQSGGKTAEEFIDTLKTVAPSKLADHIHTYKGLWKYLDELKPSHAHMLVSDHPDEYLGTERGYGDFERPEDYLESFEQYIQENRNRLTALQLVCTRPTALDRQSLKSLRLELDNAGFKTSAIKTAWQATKNEDIAADIISYIRTLAMGTTLMSHEDRIKGAIKKVKALRPWNKIQSKWIQRFEKQLLAESILKKEDLDQAPFADAGGYEVLNKIFDQQLATVIRVLNEGLYQESA